MIDMIQTLNTAQEAEMLGTLNDTETYLYSILPDVYGDDEEYE